MSNVADDDFGQTERFENLTQALMDLIRDAPEKANASKTISLSASKEELGWYRGELLECFEQIPNTTLRWNIVHFICELVENAFFVAVRTGLNKEDLEAAKKSAARHYGSKGGAITAAIKQKDALKWRAPCLEAAKKRRITSPTLSTARLATFVYEETGRLKGRDTILKFLQTMEKQGKLQLKQRA